MLPSANIGDHHALFEPVHGSAPDIAGQDRANPVAAIRSAALLLRHIGDPSAAEQVETAVAVTLSGGVKTRDIGGSAGTKAFGRAVIRALKKTDPGLS